MSTTSPASVSDYKQDADKAPVLDALLPFYPALEALARMMVDSAKKHKIEGAEDPFNQWRNLPNAKSRLANAAGRHLLRGPWATDPDSGHLHMAHALFGVLAALTLHEEQARARIPDARDTRIAKLREEMVDLCGEAETTRRVGK